MRMKERFFVSMKHAVGVFVLLLALAVLVGSHGSVGPGAAEAHDAKFTRSLPDLPDLPSLIKIDPIIKAAIAIQEAHTPDLMDIDGVVGTGIGISEDSGPAMVVFTERPGISIPLPAILDNLPVKTVVTGRFVALIDNTAEFDRPVPTGVSTGHPNITAGTIGCRVTDAAGNVYALSNNHVYADINEASIGDNVLQPGAYDGGVDPGDAIGVLADFEPILFNSSGVNAIDAAIARSSIDMLGFSTPVDPTAGTGYGAPGKTPQVATVGLNVQKYGRTTGHTHGQVSAINVTVDVCYVCGNLFCTTCQKRARFTNQIAITPGTFSSGGDSGSLIVTDDDAKNPVGLLFAGSSSYTLANPINAVLTRFAVTIDDGGTLDGNRFPVADFSFTADNLDVSFTDGSSDPDGNIASWNWDFGDGSTSTDQNPGHAYSSPGSYTVKLTVTDNEGASSAVSKTVTVTSGITLTATGTSRLLSRRVALRWAGATTANVNIRRNGSVIVTTANTGSYTDSVRRGTYTYQVCEQGGAGVCSNTASVSF